MTKEIIVNAGELESRVAIMENGRLMELHVEREPKIVGNIYKGRVTKVLKGMDAAFVDIGVERNAFLAASDVIPEGGDDEGNGHSHGRIARPNTPITQLLHNNQEVLVQVVRAPLGTKGARITTRLSLPGRYMVLMLNSGSYVGVSRKIEDTKERQRLRTLANEIRPEEYSLIVRTEAEGKSEEELRQDLHFLVDMARRIESKASNSPTPSLVHGDLTLIFRLIRDAFTRDVNRLVVDNPTTYESVLELVGMLAPRMKNRVFLYDEPMPIFHAYNVEPEIERTLRRKVWLPSGGTLIIDQAEALTAIDVNTGRFVGSVELAETVLTTNLQAADEVARQLRLRDLGGIIVVDFIDMDNPKHRQQVMAAFEEALRRDRAKIKVHSISPLGLVEMTRKRTGDSLVRLLTEPCPYCSGIGRVQNAITMALRIERELAATAVEHHDVEAYQLTAHPRVIASMLGFEGEAHRDLEAYLGRPVYLRIADDFHPNAYHLEKLSLEQALAAVKHLEDDQIIEGQVVNPDPEVSLSPLILANGMFVIVPDLDAPVGAYVKIRITQAGTSLAIAEPLAAEQRGIRTEEAPVALKRPPLVPEAILPPYLREERSAIPPRGLQLLSPTAEAVPTPIIVEEEAPSATAALADSLTHGRRKKNRRRRRGQESEAFAEVNAPAPAEVVTTEEDLGGEPELGIAETTEVSTAQVGVSSTELAPGPSRRRRRRRRGRGAMRAEVAIAASTPVEATPISGEAVIDEIPASETVVLSEAIEQTQAAIEASTPIVEAKPSRRRNRRRRGGAETVTPPEELSVVPTPEPEPEPILEEITPEAATQVMLGILNAIPAKAEPVVSPAEPAVEVETQSVVPISEILVASHEAEPETVSEQTSLAVDETPTTPEKKPRRATRRRTSRKTKSEETTAVTETESVVEELSVLPVVEAAVETSEEAPAATEATASIEPVEVAQPAAEEKPKRRRRTTTTTRRRTKKADIAVTEASETPSTDTTDNPPKDDVSSSEVPPVA